MFYLQCRAMHGACSFKVVELLLGQKCGADLLGEAGDIGNADDRQQRGAAGGGLLCNGGERATDRRGAQSCHLKRSVKNVIRFITSLQAARKGQMGRGGRGAESEVECEKEEELGGGEEGMRKIIKWNIEWRQI